MKIHQPLARAVAACLLAALTSYPATAADQVNPIKLRDMFWVWDTPERAEPGNHTLATFVQATGAQKAKLLGTPNIIMAGAGIPNDTKQADAWTKAVSHCPRIVWEICPDNTKNGEVKPPFDYTKRIQQVAKLAEKYPAFEGVLLDDMSSVGIDHGFKPNHVKQIRSVLDKSCPQMKIWGVLYSMNFDRAGVIPIVKETDVVNLWVWHARDLVNLEKYVSHCEKTFPGKPIVLGLYLRDYGCGKRMTQENMKLQCEIARKLAHQGRIKGVVFLTIDNDPEIVAWTADWIKRVGDEKIGSPTALKQTSLPLRMVSYKEDKPQEKKSLELHLGDSGDWHFLGGMGPWTETDGIIHPPNERNLHSRTFYTKASFADLNAEFEFKGNYRELGTGAAALIIRATDANHCYMVYFPWGGQQLRAKHFWAQLMKVDGDGYLRSLKSAWVPGVPSETDRWYKVRVEAEGPTINVWVDGRKALSVSDKSFKSGVVGLAGYGWYSFRNVKINGDSKPIKDWDRKQTIPVHHFTLGGMNSQVMPSGCVASNGDVLIMAGKWMARSKDKGRTWGELEALPEQVATEDTYGNAILRTRKGRLIVQNWKDREKTKKEVPEISISESTDNGLTWSKAVQSTVAAGWPAIPAKLVPYGPLVEGPDGTLLRFLLGNAGEGSKFGNVVTWSSVHCKAYIIRSTDDGTSWSAAVEIDRPAWCNQPRGTIPGSLDLTEPTGVFLDKKKIAALVRPIYSPYMWQCWSNDSGANWDAATRATFPGYAQSMIRTGSGVVVCAHRFPQYSINVSCDDGLHWDEGTVIDYPAWAMGCIVEVEPDVLLCTYMNWERGAPLLGQLIRVTTDGIEPVNTSSIRAADEPNETKQLKDCLWVWGNPEMTTDGEHTAATFAQASPAERAKLLGTPNIMMAGEGIPNDDVQAETLTKQVAHCPRILWEISADGDGGPPFVYEKRIAQVHNLAEKFPQIEGVILDDMSSAGMDKGFKARNIADIRKLLGKANEKIKIWGVVYTMNLHRPGMNECIKELDVILLCEWFGRKVGDFEKAVAYCELHFPDKPIVLGTYLYDYGIGKRMTPKLLELQYDVATELFKAGRIEGIEITTIDNDAEAVAWAADWIKKTGNLQAGVSRTKQTEK